MFDSDYLGAWDLMGKDVTVTISEVKGGKVKNQTGKEARKPIVMFKGKAKGLLCNKTNAKTIAAMYGSDVSKWVNRRITLYPTTTTFGSQEMECIRVRPSQPRGADSPPDPAGLPSPEEIAAIKARELAESREPGMEG